jgi:hypothetical protein
MTTGHHNNYPHFLHRKPPPQRPTKADPKLGWSIGTVKYWICQAKEHGELFKGMKKRKNNPEARYQTNIYAVLYLVIKLVKEGYEGEIIAISEESRPQF